MTLKYPSRIMHICPSKPQLFQALISAMLNKLLKLKTHCLGNFDWIKNV